MFTESTFISEVFSSTQGEGLYIGCRQVFIRFAGCNLSCTYCDTDTTREPPYCQLEAQPGSGNMERVKNRVAAGRLVDMVKCLNPELHHSISLTGGEPLLHAGYLEKIIPALRQAFPRVYLETNGTLPGNLERVIHGIDIVAMDMKLPGVTGLPGMWEQHRTFLKTAVSRDTFVKVVVSENTTLEEIDRVLEIITGVKKVPLVIQPVTYSNYCDKSFSTGISPRRLLQLQERALKYLDEVRVIPQAHKMTCQL